MRRGSLIILAAGLFVSLASVGAEQTLGLTWPKLIESGEGSVLVHQPQIESFGDGQVSGRAALVLEPAGRTDSIYGVGRFHARAIANEAQGEVAISDITISDLEFPDAASNQLASRIISNAVQSAEVSVPLDYLETGVRLSSLQQEQQNSADFNLDAPKVYVSHEPTLLVLIDGAPKLGAIDGSAVKRVVNTPFDVVFYPTGGTYYLRAGKSWFAASNIYGPWGASRTVPAAVSQVPRDSTADTADTSDIVAPSRIIVSSEDATLVEIEGEIQMSPLGQDDLLYVRNTAADLLYDIKSQKYYLHLSGRWFATTSLDQPDSWRSVDPDALPPALADIPADSPLADVRDSVPGTPEAQEAAIEAQIPETAEVDRTTTTLDVSYAGDPRFDDIDNTELAYATNTDYAVIRYDDNYYAVNDGVWFNSYSPYGPWIVATVIPRAIYGIPSYHPLYPVTFVYIYYSGPRYSYFSYYPGYTGRYFWRNRVLRGTGWNYSPYYDYDYDPYYWGPHIYASSYLPGFSFFLNITIKDRDHDRGSYRNSRFRTAYWNDQRQRRNWKANYAMSPNNGGGWQNERNRRHDGRRETLYDSWSNNQVTDLNRRERMRNRLGTRAANVEQVSAPAPDNAVNADNANIRDGERTNDPRQIENRPERNANRNDRTNRGPDSRRNNRRLNTTPEAAPAESAETASTETTATPDPTKRRNLRRQPNLGETAAPDNDARRNPALRNLRQRKTREATPESTPASDQVQETTVDTTPPSDQTITPDRRRNRATTTGPNRINRPNRDTTATETNPNPAPVTRPNRTRNNNAATETTPNQRRVNRTDGPNNRRAVTTTTNERTSVNRQVRRPPNNRQRQATPPPQQQPEVVPQAAPQNDASNDVAPPPRQRNVRQPNPQRQVRPQNTRPAEVAPAQRQRNVRQQNPNRTRVPQRTAVAEPAPAPQPDAAPPPQAEPQAEPEQRRARNNRRNGDNNARRRDR